MQFASYYRLQHKIKSFIHTFLQFSVHSSLKTYWKRFHLTRCSNVFNHIQQYIFICCYITMYVCIYLFTFSFIPFLLTVGRNCFLLQSAKPTHRHFTQSSLCNCSCRLAVDRLVIFNCVTLLN